MKIKINKRMLGLILGGGLVLSTLSTTNVEKNEIKIGIEEEIDKEDTKTVEIPEVEYVMWIKEPNQITKNDKVIKNVYLNEDAKLYKELENPNKYKEFDKYQFAKVYDENDKYYLVKINNSCGYIEKEVATDLEDIYVVVDLSSQKMKLYKDTDVILKSDVVTGKLSSPTRKGIFEIFEISHNRELVGPDYRSYVDVMMKFDNGIGLHDAEFHTDYDSYGRIKKSHGWRYKTSFGGEIYKYNGSHGCVNMPHDEAIETSKYVKIGTKVLVKD